MEICSCGDELVTNDDKDTGICETCRMMNDAQPTITKIEDFLTQLYKLLEYKNDKYNDSLQNPHTLVSKLEVDERIVSRIEDKLNRIIKHGSFRKNDTVDLIGYLVHLCVARGWINLNDLKD